MVPKLVWIGLLCTTLSGCAELDQSLGRLGLPPLGQPALDEPTITAGLKEALRIGASHAVTLTGNYDGYLRNPSIKILLPEQLQAFDKGLRLAGFGPQIDDFVISMNRAAERAAPQARQIFLGAISQMTFAEARQILHGGATAATDYFKARTEDQLTAAFTPHVEQAMNETGVTRQYKELTGRLKALPLAKSDLLDIDQYVVRKSLDGLFLMLANEEREIRANPSARSTALLKQVFSARPR